MNALPTTLMLAPTTMAPPAPTPGAPARDGSEPGFAQCLEQAVERDPVATDAAGKAAKEAPATDETTAPEAADTTSRSTVSRGARRTANVTPDPRKAEQAGAATAVPLATPETAAAAGAVDASAEDLATPRKPDGAPELASLLPGWAPTPAAPVAPAMPATPTVGSAGHGDNAVSALAATALATQSGLPAEPNAGSKALRADELGTAPTFTLPQPALAVQSGTPSHDASALAQAHVAAPVDSPAFAPALATQVRWLVRDGLQHAQLSLNPAEMGPVTVQIVLDGREARIDLRADLAFTRQALESSLPVLAAALDESGLRLAGGGVHDGQASRQGAGQQGWNGATARSSPALGDASGGRDTMGPPMARIPVPTRGLVDLVA